MYNSDDYKRDKLISLTGSGYEKSMAELRCIHYEHGRIEEADRLFQRSPYSTKYENRESYDIDKPKPKSKWDKQPRRRNILIVLYLINILIGFLLMADIVAENNKTWGVIGISLFFTVCYTFFYFDNYG